jgi:hypothetical protein
MPNGGKADFLRINLSECLKLQNVSGNDGYISRDFIELPFRYRIRLSLGIDGDASGSYPASTEWLITPDPEKNQSMFLEGE